MEGFYYYYNIKQERHQNGFHSIKSQNGDEDDRQGFASGRLELMRLNSIANGALGWKMIVSNDEVKR